MLSHHYKKKNKYDLTLGANEQCRIKIPQSQLIIVIQMAMQNKLTHSLIKEQQFAGEKYVAICSTSMTIDCTVRQMILLQNYYEQRDFNILIWVDSFKKLSIHSTTRFTQDKFFSLFHKIFAVPNRLTKLEFCIAMLSFMLPLKRRQLPSLSPVIF